MPASPKPIIVAGPRFTLVLWMVGVLCSLSLVSAVLIAFFGPDPLNKGQEVSWSFAAMALLE